MHAQIVTSPSKATISTIMSANDSSNRPQQQHHQQHQLSLPQTLMKLLMDGSASEAIWWLPGGKEFAINATLFPSQVLEVYFPGCKYASFIRRVHKMGFSRETRALKKVTGMKIPPNTVAFRHENFRRDQPELAAGIKQRASGNGGNHTKSAQAKKAAKSSVSSASSRSSSPSANSEVAAASPVVGPASAQAPVESISFPTASAFRPVAASPAVSMVAAVAPEEQQQEEKQLDPVAADSVPSALGGESNPALMQYLQTLRQQQRAQQDQLLYQRVQRDEVLLRQLEQERQLRAIILEEQSTREQLRLAQERILRRQLLAAAPASPTSLRSTLPTAQLQQQPSLLTSLRSPVSAPSATTSIQDDVLRRLQLIRQLQQQQQQQPGGSASGAASVDSQMDQL